MRAGKIFLILLTIIYPVPSTVSDPLHKLLKCFLGDEWINECKYTRKQGKLEKCNLKLGLLEGLNSFKSRITQEGTWDRKSPWGFQLSSGFRTVLQKKHVLCPWPKLERLSTHQVTKVEPLVWTGFLSQPQEALFSHWVCHRWQGAPTWDLSIGVWPWQPTVKGVVIFLFLEGRDSAYLCLSFSPPSYPLPSVPLGNQSTGLWEVLGRCLLIVLKRPPGSSRKELLFAPLWGRGFLLWVEQRQLCLDLILQLGRLVLFWGQLLGEGRSLPVLMRSTCLGGGAHRDLDLHGKLWDSK